MIVSARAKLNLFLHVVGKRPDGYHALQSAVVFLDLADALSIAPSPQLTLACEGPFASGLEVEDNLVLRAARALHPGGGAAITLTKNIPVGAGLGGGSSDAAAVLRALNTWWGLGHDMAALEAIAATLGSDVPA